MYFDTHCHLQMLDDADEAALRAKKKNVFLMTNGLDLKSNKKVLELSEKHDNVFCSMGLYPLNVSKMRDEDILEVIDFINLNKENVYGIGEIGLDYTEDEGAWPRQREVFTKLVLLAKELDVPVIVHSRKAEKECIEILEELHAKKVVMHYFSGKTKLAERIAANGWTMSVPSSVVYAENFQRLAQKIDLKNLLCETDSPYSHPKREFPNEPLNVIYGYEKIAEIKGMKVEEVCEQMKKNFDGLFGKAR